MGLVKTILTKLKIRAPDKYAGRSRAQENNVVEADVENDNTNDILYYKKLYMAAREGDWKAVNKFFRRDPGSVTAKITKDNETALHVVVGAGHKNELLKYLIDLMPEDTLGLTDGNDETALSVAAIVGNMEAVKLLVGKNQYLPYIWSGKESPLHRAAQYGHREIVEFLLEKTKPNIGRSPYSNLHGVLLLQQLIISRLYDIALRVIKDHPNILKAMPQCKEYSPLMAIANQPSSFLSGASFNSWERIIYHCMRSKNLESNKTIEDHNQCEDRPRRELSCCSKIGTGCRNACAGLWQTILNWLHIKQVQDKKKMHKNVQDVVEHICVEICHLGHEEVQDLLKDPFLLAATWGIKEIVIEIIKNYPPAIWFNWDGNSVFHLAVLNRRREIFSLIEEHNSDVNQIIRMHIDRDRNNLLHVAAKLAPPHRLSHIAGVVLQMQDELQWFEDVKECVEVHYRDSKNNDGKTPEMVFIEAHKGLVTEAADWMNKTASACSTAATLIATVVFAAAITVPGGNNSETGLPVLLQRKIFNMFAVADATSLFSSVASLLMFLSILTSRYSHEDFHKALPGKLIAGLITLFFAMGSLIFAFSTTLYLVLGYGNKRIFVTMYVLAVLVALIFMLLFSSLVGRMIWSTYGTTILRYIICPLRWLCRIIIWRPIVWLIGIVW